MSGDVLNLLTSVQSASDAAVTAILEKRPLDAIEYYEAALRLPEAASAAVRAVLLGNLGLALLEARRPREARKVLLDAVVLTPDSSLANRNLGDAYSALGDMAGARRSYERSIAFNPEDWVAFTRLGTY